MNEVFYDEYIVLKFHKGLKHIWETGSCIILSSWGCKNRYMWRWRWKMCVL